MRETLIARRPKPKPKDDHFMLDRWTPATAHQVRQMYRIEKRGECLYAWYRVECDCGWRSQELPRAVAAECPVQVALAERARHLRRDGERIEWKPYKGMIGSQE